jgi:ATP/maltotriose-dependent transcriptional regulator MalT
MCLSSIAIDVQIGGRFQVAKTLANIGMAYARLGDVQHGLAYLVRAREAHQRYDDKDGRVDTLLVTATVLIEQNDVDGAKQLTGEAAALVALTGNVYDRIHLLIVCALIARAERDTLSSASYASEARQLAEGQALVSYHVFATAIEAAARVDAGDTQAGQLLATTALGAVEAMEGSEYGVHIRSLCCQAVIRALHSDNIGSTRTMTADICRRALDHVDHIAGYIRDPHMREIFLERPPVKYVVDHAIKFSSPSQSSAGQ